MRSLLTRHEQRGNFVFIYDKRHLSLCWIQVASPEVPRGVARGQVAPSLLLRGQFSLVSFLTL